MKKSSPSTQVGAQKQLAKLLLKAKTEPQMLAVLQDLFTPKEIKMIDERLQIIKMLAQKKSQRAIKKDLKVSIALVTRGSHALQKNHGGFPLYIKHFVQTKSQTWRSTLK